VFAFSIVLIFLDVLLVFSIHNLPRTFQNNVLGEKSFTNYDTSESSTLNIPIVHNMSQNVSNL